MIVSTEGVRLTMPAAHPRSAPPCGGVGPATREADRSDRRDLGISESRLRRWMGQADVDDGHREGLTRDERADWSGCAGRSGCWRWRPKSPSGLLRISPGRTSSPNRVPAGPGAGRAGFPVAVTAGSEVVSTSGFYEWRGRPASPGIGRTRSWPTRSPRSTPARGNLRVRRIHAELRLGHGVAISHKRVWRCMKLVGLQGVHRCRWRLHRPAEASRPDLVNRQFHAEGPDRLWVTDITPHRTAEGWSTPRSF